MDGCLIYSKDADILHNVGHRSSIVGTNFIGMCRYMSEYFSLPKIYVSFSIDKKIMIIKIKVVEFWLRLYC